MKKNFNQPRLGSTLLKFDLKMKLTLLLLLSTLLGLHANDSYAQKAKVSLDVQNAAVQKVIDNIESTTKFNFVYNTEHVDLQRKVSLKFNQEHINKVLERLFSNTSTNYKVKGTQVILWKGKVQKVAEEPTLQVYEVEPLVVQSIITGMITDIEGMPLAGANILEKGTTNGTQADFDGNFSISVEDSNAVLVISYVGFATKEVGLNGQTNLNITLEESAAGLDEVVVVGYGTQQKKDVTGSIASISAESIGLRSVTSVEESLSGLAPGLNISTRSNSPGGLSRVTVRAIGSLSAGYEPLWVVDGFPTDQRNVQAINPSDIQSVEILKDASSTAIYGSRGANGVIIITTKSGKVGLSSINVSMKTGVSVVPEHAKLDVLNSKEYVQFFTEANGGNVPSFISNYWDGVTDTNWQDAILKTGVYQDYALSASGGTEKVSYLLSGNYISQEGVIPVDGFKKYSARVKVEYRPTDKITFGVNLAPNLSTITGSNNGSTLGNLFAQAVLLPPIIPVRNADGSFGMGADVNGLNSPAANPLEVANLLTDTEDIFRMLGGISLAVEPMDGLIFKSTISTNIGTNDSQRVYNPPVDDLARAGYSIIGQLNLRKSQQIGWLNENTVNFKRLFGNHALDVLGGFTLQRDHFESLVSNVQDLQILGPTLLSLGDANTLTSFNTVTENSLVSYLGRLNYSYKDRYLVTGTLRTDGSSRFGSDNRTQTFGSFALGWRLSEEAFIQKLGFVDDAKIRGSYGSTGSNAIPDFIAKSSLSPVNHAFGGVPVTGVSISSPGNPNLTWETSTQLDIGLDATLFGGRLDLILDYYNNETTSLLLSRNLVPSSGYTGFLTNIGSMRNKGVEVSLNSIVIDSEDFEWSMGGNVTNNDQEILDLGGDDEIRNFFGALRRTVGGELQNIHVTEAIGIYREGQTLGANEATTSATPTPGSIIYRDVNGDGLVSNFLGADGQNLQGTNVDWTYGINTNLRYKNFDFSAILSGQAGASVLDLGLIQNFVPSRNLNFPTFWYDNRYVSESQPGDGRIPAAGQYNDGISTVSSLGIQSTDYLRLKNITLGYNFQKRVIEKFGIKNARVYTSAENVHTWTNFVGTNPDFRSNSGGGPSLFGGSRIGGVSDELELGITGAIPLPLPITWTLGLNFTF
jgi:TonB-linked SusC/RagA family outer membrane protein